MDLLSKPLVWLCLVVLNEGKCDESFSRRAAESIIQHFVSDDNGLLFLNTSEFDNSAFMWYLVSND